MAGAEDQAGTTGFHAMDGVAGHVLKNARHHSFGVVSHQF
jgi:hypothetical protein